MDALHVKQRELVHLATHDVLTGLPNRMLFMEKLERAIQDATRRREGLAVLFVDLDRFKQINDQFGHAVGDKVLVAVALRPQAGAAFRRCRRASGRRRIHVLIEGPRSAEAAPGIASRIMTTLNEEIVMDGQGMTVGASIGISQFPDDSGTAEELLLNADAAMYAAKSGGRCAYLRYHDVLEARVGVSRRSTIEVVQATAGDGPPEGREAEPTA